MACLETGVKKTNHIGLALLTGLLVTPGAVLTAQEPQKAQESQNPPRINAIVEKKFSAGLMLGEPTGASFKYWISDVSAVDGLLGVSFQGENNFTLHADYLYHFNHVIPLDENRLSVYVGGGPRFKVRDHGDDLFGIRVVGGLDYIFDDIPVDVFFEAGPVFDMTPDFEVRYTVGVGARYRF